MKTTVPFELYWYVLVPVSIFGTVSNVLLIWVWSTTRYKFNRLILISLAAFQCLYFISYHIWNALNSGKDTNEPLSRTVLFTLRQYVATLYVFLSVMQYFYSANSFYYQKNPRLVSKARTTCGLVLLGLWCTFSKICNELLERKISESQKDALVSGFTLVCLIVPYALHIYCLVAMVFNMRRTTHLVKQGRLFARISTTLDIHASRASMVGSEHMVIQAIRQSVRKSLANLSDTYSSTRIASWPGPPIHSGSKSRSSTTDCDPRNATDVKIFSPRTYRRLVRNHAYEETMTKAVIAVSIFPIIAFPVGFSAVAVILITDQDALNEFMYAVVDVLQFVNASVQLSILAAMLPSFRHDLILKLSCWSKLKRIKKNNSSKSDSSGGARKHKASTVRIPTSILQHNTHTDGENYTIQMQSISDSSSSSEESPQESDSDREDLTAKLQQELPSELLAMPLRDPNDHSGDTEGKASKRSVSFNIAH